MGPVRRQAKQPSQPFPRLTALRSFSGISIIAPHTLGLVIDTFVRLCNPLLVLITSTHKVGRSRPSKEVLACAIEQLICLGTR